MAEVVTSPLGILAGGGYLPRAIIEACQKKERDVFVLCFKEAANPADFSDVAHSAVRLGAIGEALSLLRKAGVQELIMAGDIKRPSLSSLKPDLKGAKLLARLGSAFFSGDDALLTQLVRFLEDEKFKVLSISDVLSEILAPRGSLGVATPTEAQMKDIREGLRIAKAIGALDIGQGAVIENGLTLGVEAIEGTDVLLARTGNLRRDPAPSGVLVKCAKPNQEARADLPTIGVQTVINAHAAGLSGIAVEAGSTIIIDIAAVIEKANECRMFIYGIHEA